MQKIIMDRSCGIRNIVKIVCLFSVLHSYSGFSQTSEDRNKIRTVVLDAGHGGKDPGALGKDSKEKDITLALVLKIGKLIEEKIPDIKVIYTRKTDEFIPLYERAKIANDNKADLFISIHVNSNTSSTPSGPSTHILGLHRVDENFEVAKRENSVILLEEDYSTRYENFDPSSPESYIMFSLLQNVYRDQSIEFAQLTQDQFKNRAKRNDRGIVEQGLLVLAQTSMPGVLIETGFISNPGEESFLMSESGQEIIASAIYRSFRDYKNIIEGNLTPEEQNTPPAPIAMEDPKPDSTNDKPINQEPVTTPPKSNNVLKPDSLPMEIADSTVVYKVQILYSENKVDPTNAIFKDFSDVQEITISGKYKYVIGANKTYSDAIEYSKWVKSRYPDAFIVAISNGKIIPLSQALKISESK